MNKHTRGPPRKQRLRRVDLTRVPDPHGPEDLARAIFAQPTRKGFSDQSSDRQLHEPDPVDRRQPGHHARMNSETVDLIYLDPPFNSNRTYQAPIGSAAAGAAFKDAWTLDDVDLAWHGEIADRSPALYEVIRAAKLAHGPSMMSYLIMMAVRLTHLRRILKPSGSIYLHCDPTASHYLKLLMDVVFGRRFFRNEIVWSYRRWPSKQNNFQRMHDIILRYSVGPDLVFNVAYEPPSESYLKRFKGKTQVLDPVSGTRKLVVDKPTKGMPLRMCGRCPSSPGQARNGLGIPHRNL